VGEAGELVLAPLGMVVVVVVVVEVDVRLALKKGTQIQSGIK
jgi:hypothetical protein